MSAASTVTTLYTGSRSSLGRFGHPLLRTMGQHRQQMVLAKRGLSFSSFSRLSMSKKIASIVIAGTVCGSLTVYYLNNQIVVAESASKLSYNLPQLREVLPSREDMKANLRNKQFDVLIVGGGASGAGVALDAVTRGVFEYIAFLFSPPSTRCLFRIFH